MVLLRKRVGVESTVVASLPVLSVSLKASLPVCQFASLPFSPCITIWINWEDYYVFMNAQYSFTHTFKLWSQWLSPQFLMTARQPASPQRCVCRDPASLLFLYAQQNQLTEKAVLYSGSLKAATDIISSHIVRNWVLKSWWQPDIPTVLLVLGISATSSASPFSPLRATGFSRYTKASIEW